jgi:hypothetical protein
MNVSVTDSPRGCLKRLGENDTVAAFRTLMLNDFKQQGQGHLGSDSLRVDEHVCNRKVLNKHG